MEVRNWTFVGFVFICLLTISSAVDPCFLNSCVHGTCIGNTWSDTYICSCYSGYYGRFCDNYSGGGLLLPIFAIVLIVVGCLLVLSFCIGCCICCAKKKKTTSGRVLGPSTAVPYVAVGNPMANVSNYPIESGIPPPAYETTPKY